VLSYSNYDRIMMLSRPSGNWKWDPVQTLHIKNKLTVTLSC